MVIFVVVGTWWLWVLWGHEYRSVGRLVRLKVVSPVNHCRLLCSTGYSRENRFVFECEPGDILATNKGGVRLVPVDLEEEGQSSIFADRIRTLMDGCIQPPVNWKEAEVCTGDSEVLLAMVYTVKSGGRFFVAVDVF